MQTYKTSEGDVLDEVLWRQYGKGSSEILRTVFDANFGLADLGPILPAGVEIVLPDIVNPTAISESVSLWS